MKKYFLKYSIILIISVIFIGLIKTFLISQLQIIFNKGIDFDDTIYWENTALIYIPYFINMIISIFILSDLIKLKIKTFPVVLLSIFSNYAGIIFFLFLVNNKISNNDK